MAESPITNVQLEFPHGCPDCGRRQARMPDPLPNVGDDFDWPVRDYDSFRLFMLQELAARFPQRDRWTPADMEVVLVEVFAAMLDQLSDMADRVAAEAHLETARHPQSVRRLLSMIGYDGVQAAQAAGQIASDQDSQTAAIELERYWLDHPDAMEAARRAGPRAVRTQRRMVTVADHAHRLQEHPLVMRAHAWSLWSGSWTTIRVAVILWDQCGLDEEDVDYTKVRADVEQFHRRHGLRVFDLSSQPAPTIRTVLGEYLQKFRMAGQEVVLQGAEPVGVTVAMTIQVTSNYFQSEISNAVNNVLGRGPEGFFAPGRLRFGEDLVLSDIVQQIMALDGVENVCIQRFKRLGDQFPDAADSGRIVLQGLEIAACDNDPGDLSRGYYRLKLHGGLAG